MILQDGSRQDTIASTVNSSAQLLSKGVTQVGGRLAGRKNKDTTSSEQQQMHANLEKERRYYEEAVGIAEDNSIINLDELKKQFREFDKDGSGTIEKVEMVAFIKQVAGL